MRCIKHEKCQNVRKIKQTSTRAWIKVITVAVGRSPQMLKYKFLRPWLRKLLKVIVYMNPDFYETVAPRISLPMTFSLLIPILINKINKSKHFYLISQYFHSVQFNRSVISNSWNPMDYSISGFPVHHQFPEPTQTHVHWVRDAIQPFHPLSSPSPPAFNLSQHQGLFKWISCSYQVAKVLELHLQHQSFQWIFRTDFLWIFKTEIQPWTGWISLQSKGLWRVFSNTTFKSIKSSVLSFLYSPALSSIHDYWKYQSFD